jgi:capsular exopolysaccharide synthesis family protein
VKVLDVLVREGPIVSEIRKLEARIWRRAQKEGMRTLMFTSALQGEGKSTTASLFAAAAAFQRSRSVLLVDLDFRWPNLHTYFSVEPSLNFADYLLGSGGLDRVAVPTEIPNLWIVPGADMSRDDPDRLLNSPLLPEAIGTFRGRFDLVVLDVPALLPVADAAGLIPYADGILLVVMAGQTSRHHLARAREICRGMDGNLLGLVVGNIQEAAPEYLDHSHYPRKVSAKTEAFRVEVSPEGT